MLVAQVHPSPWQCNEQSLDHRLELGLFYVTVRPTIRIRVRIRVRVRPTIRIRIRVTVTVRPTIRVRVRVRVRVRPTIMIRFRVRVRVRVRPTIRSALGLRQGAWGTLLKLRDKQRQVKRRHNDMSGLQSRITLRARCWHVECSEGSLVRLGMRLPHQRRPKTGRSPVPPHPNNFSAYSEMQLQFGAMFLP